MAGTNDGETTDSNEIYTKYKYVMTIKITIKNHMIVILHDMMLYVNVV